jgi:hypothetical protein
MWIIALEGVHRLQTSVARHQTQNIVAEEKPCQAQDPVTPIDVESFDFLKRTHRGGGRS